jgi:hypothetical protein
MGFGRGLLLWLIGVPIPIAPVASLGLRDRQAINDAEGAHRPGSSPRDHHARDAAQWDRVHSRLKRNSETEAESNSHEERRPRREQTTARILLHATNDWPTAVST